MDTLSVLGSRAAEAAMRGAAEYLRLHKVTITDWDTATRIVAERTRDAIPEALADAKVAFDCGMIEAATLTFLASMRLAGIAAAKEIAAL